MGFGDLTTEPMETSTGVPIRVLSKNVRYATKSPFNGEELWDNRKPYLINELVFHTTHCAESFICLQEVLHNQLTDILQGLNAKSSRWDYVGVGREDGKTAGEYSPIFYQPGNWKLQMWTTVWLSETPEIPSKGWDAASERILTIARFAHRQTRKSLFAMSTHLDDQGRVSRLRAAQMIQRRIREHANQGTSRPQVPVVLAGDFNSEPHEEAYMEMVNARSPMVDLHGLVSQGERYGDSHTYTGFDPAKTRPQRIDFLFLSKSDPQKNGEGTEGHRSTQSNASPGWSAVNYAVLPNRFEDGIFNSDHRAVVGDLVLP